MRGFFRRIAIVAVGALATTIPSIPATAVPGAGNLDMTFGAAGIVPTNFTGRE